MILKNNYLNIYKKKNKVLYINIKKNYINISNVINFFKSFTKVV